jgi:hypothetical protein
MLQPTVVADDLALTIAFGGVGALGALLMRRRSTMTVRSLRRPAAPRFCWWPRRPRLPARDGGRSR